MAVKKKAVPALAPQIFEHEQFGQIHFVMIYWEPWFVAADLCRALEIKQPSRALSRLDDDEKGVTTIHTLGGPQQVLIVSEPGLYRLIFMSRKPEAEKIKRWVFHEVVHANEVGVIVGEPLRERAQNFFVEPEQNFRAQSLTLIAVVKQVPRARQIDKGCKESRALRDFAKQFA